METQIPVYELAKLTDREWAQAEPATFLSRYGEAISLLLRRAGFSGISFAEARADHPQVTAEKGGRKLCICFAPPAVHPMALAALSEAQCACCDASYAEHDVYYASLFGHAQEKSLHLLGPVQVKSAGRWLGEQTEQSQFLPLRRRAGVDRFSPIFGGAALFKMDRLLIPYALEHGQLPRFSVEGLFDDQEQGESGFYALMCGRAPTHFMLVEREQERITFRRPFFFYGEAPTAELELTHSSEQTPELIELMERTGRLLYAESLEAILFPKLLATGKHYKCTLSLVADRCRTVQREFSISSGPLCEQAKRDYVRRHGEEPPADFAVRVSTAELRRFSQEPHDSYTQLCGVLQQARETEVDGQRALQWTVRAIPDNDEVEVQVFVGAAVAEELGALPQVGDVVECSGYLYASPDAVLETDESWQDSGEVAALQENRELEAQGLRAYEQFAAYSLAQAVVASAFARAGYAPVETPGAHTRDDATFVVEDPEGNKLVLFVDTLIGDAEPQFHYTEEQRNTILTRKIGYFGDATRACHCLVRLRRQDSGAAFDISLSLEPEAPTPAPVQTIREAHITRHTPGNREMNEARACRIICNAICTQDWTEFAHCAGEDMAYESLVNGTRTTGKIEYIRYMAERKKLWEEQQAWAGMSMDTGTIIYRGEKRPCFMITCYGRMVGAAIVTLRQGLISGMETLPLEANKSFEADRDCTEEPRVFHPLRGHLTPHPGQLSPLQRFCAAYLHESMSRRKTGYRWIKATRDNPAFCDMAFAHAGRVYAVCAVEVEQHPDVGGSIPEIISRMEGRSKLLKMAEQYGLEPCVFPVMRDHTPDIAHSWNLWDVRSEQPLSPDQADEPSTPPPPSDWEIICAAQTELAQLATRAGGRLLAYHDTPNLLPHFWFYDAHGKLSWVIIRPHTGGNHPDRAASEAENEALRLTPGAKGYVLDAEAYADEAYTIPALRGEPIYIKMSEPLPLEMP